MPADDVRFVPRRELLSFEEIERFVRVVAGLGVNKLRLTGGEPLVRQGLPGLIRRLSDTPGITDLALTTNGILLEEQAGELKSAGLHRLNISLDTLRPEMFERISRRKGLDRVLAGIAAARRIGFERIRLNAISIRGMTEEEIIPLARFAREHALELRFIEYMPLDADGGWDMAQVLGGDDVRATIEREIGRLEPVTGGDPSQPATDYRYVDGAGRVGFINPVTQNFCGACNRLRLTAEGQVRNCLFSTVEWDARAILRGGGSDDQLADLLRDCVGAKKPGHGIENG